MIATVAELAALTVRDPGSLLLPGDVASLFRVDPKTVSRWALAGLIPSMKTPGGHHRFRADDVLAALGADQ